jgi:hypothetical protein
MNTVLRCTLHPMHPLHISFLKTVCFYKSYRLRVHRLQDRHIQGRVGLAGRHPP